MNYRHSRGRFFGDEHFAYGQRIHSGGTSRKLSIRRENAYANLVYTRGNYCGGLAYLHSRAT